MFLAETHAELLDEGTLRFRIPGYRARYLLSPWSRGFVTLRGASRQSRPAIAWGVAAVPPPGERCPCNPSVERFLADVPLAARSRVERFEFGQCLLLSALARLAEAADLADSSPNLFWLLAVAVHEGRINADRIDALCRMKQAEIIRVLTGSGSKAQVRFMRKVRLDRGTPIDGRILLEAVGNLSFVHALRHRPKVPMVLVRFLSRFPRLADEELLPVIEARLAECRYAGPDRVDGLCRALDGFAAARGAPRARAFRDRLEEMIQAVENPPCLLRDAPSASPEGVCGEPAAFPPPPLAGTDAIVPITNLEDLDAERRAQRHCVVQYADAVQAGHVYFYRVLAPQRATLEIKMTGGKPRLGEFRIARNGKPGRASVKAIEAWFAAACGEAKDTGSLPRP